MSALRPPAVLNWAGSKGRVARHLCSLDLPDIETYHEPFLGSGAVFLALAMAGRLRHARLSDLNPSVVNLFRAVRSRPLEVVCELRLHALLDADVHFAAALARLNAWRTHGAEPAPPDARAAADTVYLLSRAFHSEWHEARDGHVRMTRRRNARPFTARPHDIVGASALLQRTDIAQADFRAGLAHAQPRDLVFLDPPYLGENTHSDPQAYNAARFTRDDLAALSAHIARLVDQGTHVVFCWGGHVPTLVPPGGAWLGLGRDAVWLSAGIALCAGIAGAGVPTRSTGQPDRAQGSQMLSPG